MRTKTHLAYIALIMLLVVLLAATVANHAQNKAEALPQSQTYDEAPKIDWTYGVDYETLVPIEELTAQDHELKRFFQKLQTIFRKKDWMKIIEISNQEHYAEQGSFLGNDTLYVYNNINVYLHWEHSVIIKNHLNKEKTLGFEALDEIKHLKLIGRSPKETYDNTYSYYGYLEKGNGIIVAVYFLITDRAGKYELTGGVG